MAAAAAAAALACASGAHADASAGAVTAVEAAHGRYVVIYHDTLGAPARLTRRLEARLGFRATHRYRHALKGFSARLTEAHLGVLRDLRAVAYVERDKRARATSTQPLAPGETLPIGVKRIRGLEATSGGVHRASTVGVAVLDTGIDLDHPDLNAKHGVNCVDPGRPAEDVHGHGTAVAGIIGARNDGAGVVGVAPGTRVHSVKVLGDDGSGWASGIICGFEWAAATRRDRPSGNDIAVVNASLSLETARAVDDATRGAAAAGVVPVVAAGNNGLDLHRFSPGRSEATLVVTAMYDPDGDPTNGGGQVELYSNWAGGVGRFGPDAGPDSALNTRLLAAPVFGLTTAPDGAYARLAGTSAATPHVAATVALCIEEARVPGECAGLAPPQVMRRLVTRAREYTHAHDLDFAAQNPDYGYYGDPLRPLVLTAIDNRPTELLGPHVGEYTPPHYGWLVAPVHEHQP